MACDRALLDAVERGTAPPTLRIYGWDPPAVSLGRHQAEPEPPALAALVALGVEWVRRPTGGRTVYHGPVEAELTYAVVARLDGAPFGGSLAVAYHRIHEALAAALGRLGVAASLAPRVPRPVRPTSRLACFAVSAPWEITAGGRKLIGSAQRSGRVAFLQHGSIPLAGDQAPLALAWPGSLAPDASTSVSAAAGRRVAFAEAARAIVGAFGEAMRVALEPGTLSRGERARVDEFLTRSRVDGHLRSRRRTHPAPIPEVHR
jgi:lipoate-protein ligase A